MSRWAFLIALPLAFAASWAPNDRARAGDEPRVIEYHNDRVTVRVHGVPVREILEEIARQGGADIRGEVRRPRAVSVEFEDILLTDALGRLLGEQNFTLTYDDTGGLRAVELLGGPEAAVAKHDENAPGTKAGDKKWKWPPTEEARHALENLETFARRPDPIRVTGRLADALGTKTPTVGQLIEASSHHEDPRVQERAIITVLRTLESDPQTRSALVTAIDAFEDQRLLTVVNETARDPEHAELFVARIARSAQQSEIRTRAGAVLQQLREQRARATAQNGGT